MTLVFRPAGERFHSQLDWLDSWHSFSFSHHHDPAWMGFGPLRVINDDTIAAGSGFGLHPHRDMEIVTVMVDGQLNHRDSMGHSEVLRAGEVQAMSAGTGVVHSEMNQGDRACRLLQIWIEPSREGQAPSYRQKPFQLRQGWVPLLDPDERQGALAINRPVRLWRARPAAGDRLDLAIAPGASGWLQLIAGQGTAFGRTLQRGDGLGFPAAPPASFEAGADGADLLLFELC
ncbi:MULTISPECIES: pirin-like bicupin family protein [unclassified Cyanobium]|uniref:pirin family protein n=1 Tax=unclassified Cyanobium TaxID=2627006 RepID=UPI0020CD1B06|nr:MULTISPECIES: pirin-like bicupin family protein [unclassified Cyanobium]MCP9857486.1 pirin family protein [Cyanobium sp. Cruz-8H5]MCP9864942.1 pirin family protein [Cyanobium sp. Cruz-8D1]